MVTLFHDMMQKKIEVYVDDIIFKSKTEEDHYDYRALGRLKNDKNYLWDYYGWLLTKGTFPGGRPSLCLFCLVKVCVLQGAKRGLATFYLEGNIF